MVAGDLVNTAARLQSRRARRAPCSWARRPTTRRPARSRTRRPASSCSRARSRRCRRGGRCGSSRSAAAAAGTSASRRRSSAATRSCGCSRTCSTPRRASGGCGWSRSRARPGSARAASRGSSSSTSTASSSRCWWHEGRSPSYGEGITFWALGEMVRSRAGLLESDDAATTRARIAEVARRARARRGASGGGSSPRCSRCSGAAEAPAGRRAGAVLGVADLLRAARRHRRRRAAVRGPPVGGPGHARLHRAHARVEPQRPDPDHHAGAARAARDAARAGAPASGRSSPSTSSRSTRRRCATCSAGSSPGLPEAAVRSIVARAEGIPLYAVETIRMLVADGRLRPRAEGGFEPAGELGELAVPGTLHALIAARLDALDAARPGAAPGRGGPRPVVHGRRAGRGRRARPCASCEARLAAARPQRAPARRDRPAIAGAWPVRVRPGAHPRGRLLDARAARPALAPPRRRAPLRVDRRRRAGGRPRGPLRRRLQGVDRGPRGGGARRRRPGSRSVPRPSGRTRSGHRRQAVDVPEQAIEITPDSSDVPDLHERAATAAISAARGDLALSHADAGLELVRSLGRAVPGHRLAHCPPGGCPGRAAATRGRADLAGGRARRARRSGRGRPRYGRPPRDARLLLRSPRARRAGRPHARECARPGGAPRARPRWPPSAPADRAQAAFYQGRLWEARALAAGGCRSPIEGGLEDTQLRIMSMLADVHRARRPGGASVAVQREAIDLAGTSARERVSSGSCSATSSRTRAGRATGTGPRAELAAAQQLDIDDAVAGRGCGCGSCSSGCYSGEAVGGGHRRRSSVPSRRWTTATLGRGARLPRACCAHRRSLGRRRASVGSSRT